MTQFSSQKLLAMEAFSMVPLVKATHMVPVSSPPGAVSLSSLLTHISYLGRTYFVFPLYRAASSSSFFQLHRLSAPILQGSSSLSWFCCSYVLHLSFENSQKMSEESSSKIVGYPPSEIHLGDAVNEVEDVMECEEDVALNGDDHYRIDGMEDIGSAWRVSYDADSNQIKCCCQRFESQGIPCAHIFAVLFFLDIGELPKSVILGRWTKMAKQGHELGAIEQGNWMGDNLIYSHLGGLMSCCRRLCNLAARNADEYKAVREKVCNEIMLLEAKRDLGEGCTSQGNCSGIMDPTRLRRRGGG
ncbi:hypothetical protein RIF29_30850 [Crotalaria pallida]|uniref:Protein FAR1-RELATED SEQUENCE n=1 Tax=Crotalaria pallida TaxID=3830 RepID=A0AAN9ENJ5_CROPI